MYPKRSQKIATFQNIAFSFYPNIAYDRSVAFAQDVIPPDDGLRGTGVVDDLLCEEHATIDGFYVHWSDILLLLPFEQEYQSVYRPANTTKSS